MHDLSGKTVLLTGASKGIGAATAMALGQAGAHLIAHYGSDAGGAEAAVTGLPPERVLLLQADLGHGAEVDRLWREALAWRGRIDVLVNNAAVMSMDGGIEADDAALRAADQALYQAKQQGRNRVATLQDARPGARRPGGRKP